MHTSAWTTDRNTRQRLLSLEYFKDYFRSWLGCLSESDEKVTSRRFRHEPTTCATSFGWPFSSVVDRLFARGDRRVVRSYMYVHSSAIACSYVCTWRGTLHTAVGGQLSCLLIFSMHDV